MNGKPAPGSRTGVPMRVEFAKKKSDSKMGGMGGGRPLLNQYQSFGMPFNPMGGMAAMGSERVMQKNVYVAQLPPEYTKEQLQALFAQFGTISECTILKDNQTGLGRGVGFVHYTTREEAQLAIAKMNNYQLPGHMKPLRCKLARDTKGTRDMQGGRGGGFTSAGAAFVNPYGQQQQGYSAYQSNYTSYGGNSSNYSQPNTGYPPAQGGFPQTPSYPPQANTGYPSSTNTNMPPQQPAQSYPPVQQQYPPAQGSAGYPPQQQGYPPQQSGYPPVQQGGQTAYGGYNQQQPYQQNFQQYPPRT